ncbi:hypothetical protein C1280_08585 [Gemmata obscuriglobus]|uniref:Uncharacterized protein n=1 Tax=Gemmata obscuriglobus TaxID=114 RepID=A0A2Z3H604_9BACT|nr:hypothetical protein C1280_08585 [Gemmata obscuriglobus]
MIDPGHEPTHSPTLLGHFLRDGSVINGTRPVLGEQLLELALEGFLLLRGQFRFWRVLVTQKRLRFRCRCDVSPITLAVQEQN